MYTVIIWATDHMVRGDQTIWSRVWQKKFETELEANQFADYQHSEFGRRATIYKDHQIIKDTRY